MESPFNNNNINNNNSLPLLRIGPPTASHSPSIRDTHTPTLTQWRPLMSVGSEANGTHLYYAAVSNQNSRERRVVIIIGKVTSVDSSTNCCYGDEGSGREVSTGDYRGLYVCYPDNNNNIASVGIGNSSLLFDYHFVWLKLTRALQNVIEGLCSNNNTGTVDDVYVLLSRLPVLIDGHTGTSVCNTSYNNNSSTTRSSVSLIRCRHEGGVHPGQWRVGSRGPSFSWGGKCHFPLYNDNNNNTAIISDDDPSKTVVEILCYHSVLKELLILQQQSIYNDGNTLAKSNKESNITDTKTSADLIPKLCVVHPTPPISLTTGERGRPIADLKSLLAWSRPQYNNNNNNTNPYTVENTTHPPGVVMGPGSAHKPPPWGPYPLLHIKDPYLTSIDTQTGNTKRLPRRRMIACHDFAGGYRAGSGDYGAFGSAPDTSLCDTTYDVRYWHHLESFIYFSHCRFTVPPRDWISVCHQHNVRCLGTIITEHREGMEDCLRMIARPDTVRMVVAQLTDVAIHYGFEGYLVNIETPVPPSLIPNLMLFVELLTKSIHAAVPRGHGQVLWYDSVVVPSGNVHYQNSLTSQNKPFFDLCDGIFVNYFWNPLHLQMSAFWAGGSTTTIEQGEVIEKQDRSRESDIFVGIDIFGRGTYGGGGYSTNSAIKAIKAAGNQSVAFFAPGWTLESAAAREGKGNTCKRDRFLAADRKFWSLIDDEFPVEQCNAGLLSSPLVTVPCSRSLRPICTSIGHTLCSIPPAKISTVFATKLQMHGCGWDIARAPEVYSNVVVGDGSGSPPVSCWSYIPAQDPPIAWYTGRESYNNNNTNLLRVVRLSSSSDKYNTSTPESAEVPSLSISSRFSALRSWVPRLLGSPQHASVDTVEVELERFHHRCVCITPLCNNNNNNLLGCNFNPAAPVIRSQSSLSLLSSLFPYKLSIPLSWASSEKHSCKGDRGDGSPTSVAEESSCNRAVVLVQGEGSVGGMSATPRLVSLHTPSPGNNRIVPNTVILNSNASYNDNNNNNDSNNNIELVRVSVTCLYGPLDAAKLMALSSETSSQISSQTLTAEPFPFPHFYIQTRDVRRHDTNSEAPTAHADSLVFMGDLPKYVIPFRASRDVTVVADPLAINQGSHLDNDTTMRKISDNDNNIIEGNDIVSGASGGRQLFTLIYESPIVITHNTTNNTPVDRTSLTTTAITALLLRMRHRLEHSNMNSHPLYLELTSLAIDVVVVPSNTLSSPPLSLSTIKQQVVTKGPLRDGNAPLLVIAVKHASLLVTSPFPGSTHGELCIHIVVNNNNNNNSDERASMTPQCGQSTQGSHINTSHDACDAHGGICPSIIERITVMARWVKRSSLDPSDSLTTGRRGTVEVDSPNVSSAFYCGTYHFPVDSEIDRCDTDKGTLRMTHVSHTTRCLSIPISNVPPKGFPSFYPNTGSTCRQHNNNNNNNKERVVSLQTSSLASSHQWILEVQLIPYLRQVLVHYRRPIGTGASEGADEPLLYAPHIPQPSLATSFCIRHGVIHV